MSVNPCQDPTPDQEGATQAATHFYQVILEQCEENAHLKEQLAEAVRLLSNLRHLTYEEVTAFLDQNGK